MVVAEGVIGEDLRDLLAGIGGDPRRDGGHLRAHVGDARLQAPAVHLARRDMITFRDDVVGNLQFACRRRGGDDDVGEQRAVDDVGLVLVDEFGHDLGAARGVGAVVLDDDLDLAAVDAAGGVNRLDRGIGGALVPAAIGGADAGAVRLEADPDRLRRLRLRIANETRRDSQARAGGQALQRGSAAQPALRKIEKSLAVSHDGSPVLSTLTNENGCFQSCRGSIENCMYTN